MVEDFIGELCSYVAWTRNHVSLFNIYPGYLLSSKYIEIFSQISVRIYASADRVGYDLAPWLGLEDAYEEFLKILAEKATI